MKPWERTEEEMQADRARLRERVFRLTEELDVAGIPYERIVREYEASVYVPAIEDNQVMVALIGLKGAVPMQLCRREPGGGQYQSTDCVEEAVRLIRSWYVKPMKKKGKRMTGTA